MSGSFHVFSNNGFNGAATNINFVRMIFVVMPFQADELLAVKILRNGFSKTERDLLATENVFDVPEFKKLKLNSNRETDRYACP